ncbi:MAG: septum formation initiator [Alphaproteobacteria bacterium]|nr:septum formation initiator [Alphaproteobacteria bacterium]|tara:strand:+ start:1654 stop:1965 length:312 start_codon:yes stop_codon:yes gene_type:complete
MTATPELTRRLRHCILPLLCIATIGYISYHAVQGDRGLAAWRQLSQQIDHASGELLRVRSARMELEHRVSLLRLDGLDRDMLDERSHIVLGLAHPDELIFLTR